MLSPHPHDRTFTVFLKFAYIFHEKVYSNIQDFIAQLGYGISFFIRVCIKKHDFLTWESKFILH